MLFSEFPTPQAMAGAAGFDAASGQQLPSSGRKQLASQAAGQSQQAGAGAGAGVGASQGGSGSRKVGHASLSTASTGCPSRGEGAEADGAAMQVVAGSEGASEAAAASGGVAAGAAIAQMGAGGVAGVGGAAGSEQPGGQSGLARLQEILHPLGLFRKRAVALGRFSAEYLAKNVRVQPLPLP